MFIPETYKATKAESIGKWYSRVRHIAAAAALASVPVFIFLSPVIGFILAFAGFVVEGSLLSRERYIDIIRDIDNISAYRNKLVDLGEHEFVLESIASDQVWRGAGVSAEVTEKLNHIRNERAQLKSKIEDFFARVTAEYAPKTNDEGKN